jgi:hypothetical protein
VTWERPDSITAWCNKDAHAMYLKLWLKSGGVVGRDDCVHAIAEEHADEELGLDAARGDRHRDAGRSRWQAHERTLLPPHHPLWLRVRRQPVPVSHGGYAGQSSFHGTIAP